MENVTLNAQQSVDNVVKTSANHTQGSVKEAEKLTAKIADSSDDNSNKKVMSKDQLKSLVVDMNKELKSIGNKVEFGFDEDIEGMQVTIKDPKTNQILSRFPNEDAERISKAVKELVGVLFDKKA